MYMMKKTLRYFFLFILVLITIVSCNDAVFYMVSQDEKMADPLISGSPTNFVVFKDYMYVASGSQLYRYKYGIWDGDLTPPGGRIMQLAATNNFLYALCIVNDSTSVGVLKRTKNPASSDPDDAWTRITHTNFNNLQTIFEANGQLFICSRDGQSFSIFNLNDAGDNNTPTDVQNMRNIDSMLRGAAFGGGNFYLCTSGIGETPTGRIFVGSSQTSLQEIGASIGNNFMGIINLGNTANTVVAINRDGELYSVTSTSITKVASFANHTTTQNRYATGALAVVNLSGYTWNNSNKQLLLVGRQDINYTTTTGFTYGYVEIEFNDSGIIGERFFVPGEVVETSTVSNQDRYRNTIGKTPVRHLFQTPTSVDSNRILFASTQRNGVWSYRPRRNINDEYSWNAEEKPN
jgi:hypothetical protein